MARLTQLVVDCRHPAALARFWADALDGFAVRAYDEDEIRRLALLGFTPESDPTVMVDGPNLELCFQQMDVRPPTSQQTLHLDISTTGRDREVVRLGRLGAQIVERFERHTWMRDPEGNDFCVVEE